MTAVQEYQRLEAEGLYSSGPGAQRRDVVIALGDATLTIIDHRGSALAHWSLAAVERVNAGEEPALYAPGPGSPERLETENREMISAIQKVLTAVDRDRPHPGRLRGRLLLLTLLVAIAFATLWLPGAILRYTASVVPWPTRVGIGEQLWVEVVRLSGPACEHQSGSAALDTLSTRVLPNAKKLQVRIVRDGVDDTTHLPGGLILVGRSVVEDHESPEVLAGYLVVEAAKIDLADPLFELLEHVGLPATLTLMTTGRLPDGALEGFAQARLAASSPDIAASSLVPRFAEAELATTPYALAVDVTGEKTLALIEADPMSGKPPVDLIDDSQWIALQGICEA